MKKDAAKVGASQDLVYWNSLTTNMLFSAFFDFVDRSSTNYPIRFYRAIPIQE